MHVRGKRLIRWWMVPVLSVASFAAGGDLRLVEAVKNQNWDEVPALLKQRVDVNTPQGDGATTLHWATHWDDLDTVDLLIRAGAKVNAANSLGVTPISLACTNGSAAMVKRLLTAGANPNATLSTGESALMTAARTGSVDAVNALLVYGANVNAKETARGQTALMWAVSQQHSQVVGVLLEHGADVHDRSRVSRSRVYTGVSGNRATTAEKIRMIEKGGSTPLLFAARQGDLESAKLLLAAGANVNDVAPDGTTVLVMASHSGHGALAAFLLDNGADPNDAGAGYTALHAAVLRGDLDLVKALLAHGENPNTQITKATPMTREGQNFVLPAPLLGATPFSLAAKFLEVGIMRVLAARGADPLLAMKDGTTPLMAATGVGLRRPRQERRHRRYRSVPDATPMPEEERRALEAAKLALDLGADVNGVNQEGNTALHGAVSQGFNTVIRLLADHGVDLEMKNNRGQTPLAMAGRGRAGGKPEPENTADLLRKLGAKE